MVPLFSASRYTISPFFQQKVYDWPDFSWLVYERSHFYWYPSICTYFSLRDFWGFCSLGIQWIDCSICLTTSNKWVQKINIHVYESVNISDDLVYEWISFSKARYMNGVGFEKLARTLVPKLFPSYPPPSPTPHPSTESEPESHTDKVIWVVRWEHVFRA